MRSFNTSVPAGAADTSRRLQDSQDPNAGDGNTAAPTDNQNGGSEAPPDTTDEGQTNPNDNQDNTQPQDPPTPNDDANTNSPSADDTKPAEAPTAPEDTGNPDSKDPKTTPEDEPKLDEQGQKNINTSYLEELTEEINIMLSEGMLSILAMEAGDRGILKIETHNGWKYEFGVKISHSAKITPGTLFSSYTSKTRIFHDAFISEDNYRLIFNMVMNPGKFGITDKYRIKATAPATLSESEDFMVDPAKVDATLLEKVYDGENKDQTIKFLKNILSASKERDEKDSDTRSNQVGRVPIMTENTLTLTHLVHYFSSYSYSSISPIALDKKGGYEVLETFDVPHESLYIKLNPKFSFDKYEELEKILLSVSNNSNVEMTNMLRLKRDLDKAELYFRLFNIFILLLLFVLAFFLLLVFFLNMIRDRRWEFAVLRAVGLRLKNIRGVYLLEIGSNVVAALFIGAIAGFVFSSLTAIQFSTFNEIKLR